MSALLDAITHARVSTGDATAPVMVLAPARANAVLLRQRLMLEGPWINITFGDPDSLFRDLARPALLEQGLMHEPSGWAELALTRAIRDTPSAWSDTLQQPGWIRPLASSLRTLAGLDLSRLDVDHPPLELLRTFTIRLDEERARAGYANHAQILAAARVGLRRPSLPVNRAKAAVLFGDRVLQPAVHQVLRLWLESRPAVSLLSSAFGNLDPAPNGLRDTAPSAHELELRGAGSSRLGGLQFALYFTRRRTEPDASVTLARTPDDVRECEEVVREALKHVEAGVALTDIAIAVPDARHIQSLRHALLRANLPATCLVGPPLSESPSALFLDAALELAESSRTAEAWYRFLSLPGLRLRAVLGALGTARRGRWRKLLRRCGVHRGDALLDALRVWSPTKDATDPTGDIEARDSLVHAMESLSVQLDLLVEPGSWLEVSGQWASFLKSWWSSSVDRNTLLGLLGGGSDSMRLTLQDARGHLRRLLDGTPQLSGTLSDRAIRVAAPMNLLGGQFRVVLTMGLTDGRFPTRRQEDPFLPDAVLDQINSQLGVSLPTSRAHLERERRRFAALVASCTETLWLSSPAMDMGQDRPLLPSHFLLDALRAMGLAPTYASLEREQVSVGSRSSVLPPAERSLDAAEHRAARLLAAPAANAAWMCSHVLHRAQVERLLRKDDAQANVWNGLITAPIPPIPGWDDEGVPGFVLAVLLSAPERYLLRQVLGVSPASRFPKPPDPFDRKTRQRTLLDLFDVDQDIDATVESFDAHIRERFGGDWPAGMRDLALQIARTDAEKVHQLVPAMTPAPEVVAHALDSALPWRLRGEQGFVDDNTFYSLDLYATSKDVLDHPATALHAIAVGTEEWTALTPFSRKPKTLEMAEVRDRLLVRLRAVHEVVETGWWPREVGE
jgi:hypothetical protein